MTPAALDGLAIALAILEREFFDPAGRRDCESTGGDRAVCASLSLDSTLRFLVGDRFTASTTLERPAEIG
jgi:hypothetical protein